MSSIGQRIKEIRDYYDLTQQQFADELGLKRNTIATYETTDKEPSNNVIIAICKIWNISEDWLRHGNGKMSSIGQRIKEIRNYYELTQTGLGNIIGVKGNTITNYENDLRNPSNSVILSICRELSISEDWLRYGKGKMHMKMDKEGEIMAFIGKTFADDKPSFTKEFIHVLSKLNVEEWELLEKIANLIAEEKNS